MSLTLLGTGSADGWPNPHCSCASCSLARREGRLRGQSSALLDGTVLLDCGPEAPHAAQRAGFDLTGLRHVLLTHAHPDHCAPAFLLFRSWVAGAEPLDVVGPPAVVEQARPWLSPDTPVRFHTVAVGDRLTLSEYDVHVLGAQHGPDGAAVLYDVDGPSGRVLWGTDTGPLPEPTVQAVRGAAYDVVLLEETFGDHVGHGTDHLDLVSFPEQLRRLRAVGAVTDSTDVVAVHLSHRNPHPDELSRRLAVWGARVVDDGTTLGEPDGDRPLRRSPGRTLVVGGARSGKSLVAEALLADQDDVTYVATAYPADHDDEWSERVRLHQARRPAHWSSVETLDLVGLLEADGGPLLVDCLTLWLTRVMDAHDAWNDSPGEETFAAALDALVTAWRTTGRRVVLVTNEVGHGVVPDTASGRRFRDELGRLNARIAGETEDVLWCVAGRVSRL